MRLFSKALVFCAVAVTVAALAHPSLAQQRHPGKVAAFYASEALAVNSTVLAPGIYFIELAPSVDNNLLYIMSADRTKVLATVLASHHPIRESEVRDVAGFVYDDCTAARPNMLVSWFPAGLTVGYDLPLAYAPRAAGDRSHLPETTAAGKARPEVFALNLKAK